MRPYTHLSKQERLFIEQKLQQSYSLSQIARMLNRHPSTISREVRRNELVRHYSARYAHEEARARRKNANASKSQTIYNYIRRKSGILLNSNRGFFWLPSWNAKR